MLAATPKENRTIWDQLPPLDRGHRFRGDQAAAIAPPTPEATSRCWLPSRLARA